MAVASRCARRPAISVTRGPSASQASCTSGRPDVHPRTVSVASVVHIWASRRARRPAISVTRGPSTSQTSCTWASAESHGPPPGSGEMRGDCCWTVFLRCDVSGQFCGPWPLA
eukprot:5318958-Lingulodinium_polyedra.AAC.1